MMFDQLIGDTDLAPRPGLVDLVLDAFASGVWVGVVTNGSRSWAEPLIRALVGDGLVETVVTADDVKTAMPDREAHQNALWELGIPAENAIAVTGSASGLRAATSAGLATVVITGDGTPDIAAAVSVRPDFGGSDPLLIADCQRLHGRWWAAHKRAAA
jgi:HAD superfamily hydrolase (TIGR01509 family)